MRLCHCKDCTKKFRTLKGLSQHRNKHHKGSVSASIRNGIKNSKKTPQRKSKELSKVMRDIAGVAAGIAPAIIARNPALAIGAVGEIQSLIKSVEEYLA